MLGGYLLSFGNSFPRSFSTFLISSSVDHPPWLLNPMIGRLTPSSSPSLMGDGVRFAEKNLLNTLPVTL
jgi:hypothetical protein